MKSHLYLTTDFYLVFVYWFNESKGDFYLKAYREYSFDHLILTCKVEKILKGSLDSIPSTSPSVKIQIIGGKVYLR
jgi:hypothetical protein